MFLCFVLSALLLCSASPGAATLVITGARVWTGNPRQPWAEAVAVAGERIVAVGSADEVGRLASGSTRVIEAAGRMLIPGFTDSHTHLQMPAPEPTPVTLRFVKTRDKFVERIGAYASKAPKGSWILGGDWDHRRWGGEMPSRHWIDRVTPDNPVWLYHAGQEMGLANSAALRAAGITRDTRENPPGGITRDAQAEPTGIVRLSAMSLLDAAAEAPAQEKHDRILDDYMRRMAAQGTTSVHNTTGWPQLLVFRRARESGRLRTRIYAALAPIQAWRRLVEYCSVHGSGGEWLCWTAVKGYARNWPEAKAALPAPESAVESSFDDFESWVSGASAAGLQVLVHDGGGIHQLMEIFERVKRAQDLADPRFRIEHVFFVTASDAARFAGAGAIASLQPELASAYDDPAEFEAHLPYRRLLEAGARIAFGSDQVIGAPLAGIALAVNHPISGGSRMSVEEALRAYTSDAAYAAFDDKQNGTLEPGKLADMVLIDRDLTRIPPREIRDAKVIVTIVGGRVVYESDAAYRP